MKVGDRVYLKPVNNRARYIKDDDIINHVKETEIIKIGNKYFWVSAFENTKFGIKEMRDISEYCANWIVYNSIQEIEEELEVERLIWKIKTKFNGFSELNLSLDQLRRISDIIDENINELK